MSFTKAVQVCGYNAFGDIICCQADSWEELLLMSTSAAVEEVNPSSQNLSKKLLESISLNICSGDSLACTTAKPLPLKTLKWTKSAVARLVIALRIISSFT